MPISARARLCVVGVGTGLGRQLVLGADDEVAVAHLDHVDFDPVERAEALAGQDLGGGADGPAPAHQVKDAVHVGQDGVDLVGDEDDGRARAAAALVDEVGDGPLAGQVECQEGLVAQQDGRDRPSRAWAMRSRCCSPPESRPTGASA